MSAYGNDPEFHHIVDGEFLCSAPGGAPCRTSPTCECENWCCCDGSPEDVADNHDGGHCCMTTVKAEQECWIAVWVDACGVEDTGGDDGTPPRRDGAVNCDWGDGICWSYAVEVDQ